MTARWGDDRNVAGTRSEPARTSWSERGKSRSSVARFRAYLAAALRDDQIPKLPDEEDTSSKHADACDDGNVPG